MFINQNENISNRVVNFRQAQTARNNTGIKKESKNETIPENKEKKKYENPISGPLEMIATTSAVIFASLSYVFKEHLEDIIENIENKDKNCKTPMTLKQKMTKVGLAALALSAIVTLVTLPKALYDTSIKTVKKKKDMDVYIRSNEVEKKVFEKLDEKSKRTETKEDQKKLADNFLKMQSAKQIAPKSVIEDLNSPVEEYII